MSATAGAAGSATTAGAAGSATTAGAAGSATTAGCGAPDQSVPPSVDLAKETVITGWVRVAASEEPVAGAYVRLLDADGEFTAEVVSGADGQFRFFAAPGSWTVRALSRQGSGQATVTADRGLNETTVAVTDGG